jgi:transposase
LEVWLPIRSIYGKRFCTHARVGSQRALAEIFGVSLSFVEKLLRRQRTTGDIAPKPHAGGQRSHLDIAGNTLIRQLVHDHPEMTLEELCARVADARGVRVRVATMCRVLQRLGLPRKKSRSTIWGMETLLGCEPVRGAFRWGGT